MKKIPLYPTFMRDSLKQNHKTTLTIKRISLFVEKKRPATRTADY